METPPASRNKRKRGGQFGNRNAFKHGRYSRAFRQVRTKELADLEARFKKDPSLVNDLILRLAHTFQLNSRLSVEEFVPGSYPYSSDVPPTDEKR